ncbi:MAG: cell division protein FtsL [Methylovirgula sp.]
MVRILNVLAILALIGSAVYAYSIKYQTIFYAEQIVHLGHEIKLEKNRIGLLRADFAHLSRPERIAALADRFLAMQEPTLMQIVGIDGLPEKGPKDDEIARKLEALGLAQPTNTPRDTTPDPTTPPAKAR